MNSDQTVTIGELAILLYADMSETEDAVPMNDTTTQTIEGGNNDEKSDSVSCG